jgi:exopolyphosphatase/guanosine-5'-triphosphate,3'-diphosphate pyrophosphatase
MGPRAPATQAGTPAAAAAIPTALAPGPRAEVALAPQPVVPRPAPAPFYGALDLGTNNCRLLVAVPRDHGFRVVDAFSRIVRLGEGIGQTGRLGEGAMDRAIEALKVCGAKLAYRDVTRARLIATEACRTAANGDAFVDRVREETGLELEIVTRETEARLAVAGCASLVDPNASGVILFDIGGGSSELVWLDLDGGGDGTRRRMSDRIREWVSLPVGVVNLSERHGGRDVTTVQFEAMVAEVAVMLDGFPNVEILDAAVAAGEIHMLGTSGTVTTLAGVHLNLPRYDRRLVDGTWLTGEQVADLVTVFMGMDYEARCANPCIGRERADLVLAGCAILEAIRRRWPCDRLRVADRGLREGVLVELMAEDGVWRPRSGRRSTDRHA